MPFAVTDPFTNSTMKHPDPANVPMAAGGSNDLQNDEVVSGNFSGSAPTHTPSVPNQIATDTSDGTKYYFYGGAWH